MNQGIAEQLNPNAIMQHIRSVEGMGNTAKAAASSNIRVGTDLLEPLPESANEVSLADGAHQGTVPPGCTGSGVEIEVVEDLSIASHSDVPQEEVEGSYADQIVVDDVEPTDDPEQLRSMVLAPNLAHADIVSFAEKYSIEVAAKRFNLPIATIQGWVKSSEVSLRPKFNSPGQGRKISYSKETDYAIAAHIKDLISKGEKVSTQYLCNYARSIILEENPHFNASPGWAQRFILRHDIDLGDHGKKGLNTKQDVRSSERGRPLSYSTETDQAIADWVRMKQLEGTLVTNSELRKHAKTLILKENPNFTGSASWAQNFLLRHKLSLHNGGNTNNSGDSVRLGAELNQLGSPQSISVSVGVSLPSGVVQELTTTHSSSIYADTVVPVSSEYTPDPSADDPMKTALAILTGENIDSALLNPAQAAALQNTLSELASENVSLVDLLNNAQSLHEQGATSDGGGVGFSHSIDGSSGPALYLSLPTSDATYHTLTSAANNLASFKLNVGRFDADTGPASRPLSYTKETDHVLAKWVQEQQASGKKVTFASLRSYAKKLVQTENPNFNASVGWVTPFLLRHNLDLSVNKKKKPLRKPCSSRKMEPSGSDNDSDGSPLRDGDVSGDQQDDVDQSNGISLVSGEEGVGGEPGSMSVQVLRHFSQVPIISSSSSERVHENARSSLRSADLITSSTTDDKFLQEESGIRSGKKGIRNSARSRHTLAEKLEVVRLMKEYNVAGHYVCRMLGIANSTIAGWIKLVQQKGPELEALSVNKKRANVSGQGRPLSYSREKDDAIAKWVTAQQELGAQVTSSDLARYATSLIGQENANFTASTGWQQKFLQRHNLQLTPKTTNERIPLLEDQQNIPAPVQTEEVITHDSSLQLEKPYPDEIEEQLVNWVQARVADLGSMEVQNLCQYAEDIITPTNPTFVATLGWAFRFLHRNKLLLDPKPHVASTDGAAMTPLGTPSAVSSASRRRPLSSPEFSTPKKLRTQLEQAVTMSPSTGNLCEALLALSNPGEGATPESVQAVMEVVESAMQQAQAAAAAVAAAQSQQVDEEGGDGHTPTSTYFGKPAREFTPEEKEEVVRYANATTLQKAASRYGVAAPTVWRWRVELKLHQPKYTAMQKKYIIKYAENNSLKEAAQRFGITTKTIQNWRKALNAEGLMSDEGATTSQDLQEGMEANDLPGGSDVVNYDGNFQFIVDGGEVMDGNHREQSESSIRDESVPLEVTTEVDIENVGMEYDIVSSEGHSAKPRCTQQEKMQILQYALDHSIKEASQKYGISPGTLYYWKKNLSTTLTTGSGSGSTSEPSPTANVASEAGTFSLMADGSGTTSGGNVTIQFGGSSGDGNMIQVLPAIVTSDAVVLPISEALLASAGTTAETVQALSQTLASMSPEALQNLPADFNLLQAVTSLLSNVEAANESNAKLKQKLVAAGGREMGSPTDVLIPYHDHPTSDAEQTIAADSHHTELDHQVVSGEEIVSTPSEGEVGPAHLQEAQSEGSKHPTHIDSTSCKEP